MSQRPHIMIVEDDRYWIDSYRRMLRNRPVEIHDAMKVQNAIDKLDKECFASVFVDLEMPGRKENSFGGFDVLEAGREANPYTELVVITAHDEQEILSQLAQHDVSLCITKPVEFRELQLATDLVVLTWQRRIYTILRVLQTFSTCGRLLADRKHNRPNFKITNEYDVQDLLHVILKPFYPDIEPEEYTLKRAGSQKRIDLVIKGLEMVIEIKMVRSKTHAKSIADELDIDIRNYPSHPSCKRLLCFVYDPKCLISDPRKLERDLSGESTQKSKAIDVTVLVRSG